MDADEKIALLREAEALAQQDADVERQARDLNVSLDDVLRHVEQYGDEVWDLVDGPVRRLDDLDVELDACRSFLLRQLALERSRQDPAERVRQAEAEDETLQTLRTMRTAAVQQVTQALVQQVMRPRLNLALARIGEERSQRNELYARRLELQEGTLLRGSGSSRALHSDTRGRKSVALLLSRLSEGSLGVAGPRGSGKSTILNLECTRSTGKQLRIFVEAPADYVPREFLLYLYRKVCEAILDTARVPFEEERPEVTPRRLRALQDVLLVVLPSVVALVGALLVARFITRHDLSAVPNAAPLVLALATISASCMQSARHQQNVRDFLESERRVRAETGEEFLTPRSSSSTYPWYLAALYGLALTLPITLNTLPQLAWLDGRRTVGAGLVLTGLACGAASLRLVTSQAILTELVKRALFWAAVTLLVFGASLLALPRSAFAPDLACVIGAVLLVVGVAVAATGSTWRNALHELLQREAVRGDIISQARQGRRDVIFQRTIATGFTSTVRLGGVRSTPVSADSSVTATTTEAAVPWTTLDVIDELRKLFVKLDDVVIGIDELDKIESDEKARAFLNEIKGIFSLPKARFLVSMSEDAIASFERRGLAFRDVFDSAFDEVVRVPYLNYWEALRLARLRAGKDVPPPFVAFAYCLSGGLARDLIRTLDHMAVSKDRTLTATVWRVVHDEMTAKYLGTRAALRPLPLEPQVTEVVSALYRLDRCAEGGAEYSASCLLREDWLQQVLSIELGGAGLSEADLASLRTVQRLTAEYVTFAYFCRTLLEFCSNECEAEIDRLYKAERAPESDRSSLDYLARARQHLAVNPHLAWEQVSNFRNSQGLCDLKYPSNLLSPRSSATVETALGSWATPTASSCPDPRSG